jgi:methyltransferase (TIGR00027 family)
MKNNKRIENKPSSTAAWTCTCRALSFMEKRPQYKSGDNIAPLLLPKFLTFLFRINLLKKLFMKVLIPAGMYEYLIARTKYFDSVFADAIAGGFEQVLIFGAGYDTRGIRLLQGKEAKIYELDAANTQRAKINQMKKRGIDIDPNIVFIPIDFNKESLKDKLTESGFKRSRSLFLLEGLTMYLDREAVESTFDTIDEFSSDGSRIVFDYIYSSVLKRENALYGEEQIYQTVKFANEEWCFGFADGEAQTFLKNHHYDLTEELGPRDLEDRYFKDGQGKKTGGINGTHCIALARAEN